MNSNINYDTIEKRKGKGKNIYECLYLQKMNTAPQNIHKFCDPNYKSSDRRKLVQWIRNVNDRYSCQTLQILFSFSIPNEQALQLILNLKRPIVSLGSGCGYWEYLLQQRGCDIVCFDNNKTFPPEMHYLTIQEGGPEVLYQEITRALFLSWPDADENSTFSLDCLRNYKGDTIIHVGEMFGETQSMNPWGQSTSKSFQLALLENFRCLHRIPLLNWPGHKDSLTVWRKVNQAAECDGAMFYFLD